MSNRNTRCATSRVSAQAPEQASWARTALATAALLFLGGAAVIGCGALLGLNDLKDLRDEGGTASDGGETNGDGYAADTGADTAIDARPVAKTENPYGEPYPTQGIGTRVRAGSVRGSVIENLLFTGYARFAIKTAAIQLADVYDPRGREHDIVALLLEARWDVYSKQMMDGLASSPPARVAIVSVLGEGMELAKPSTLSDLASWHSLINFPRAWVVLDPSFSLFGPTLYDRTGLPAVIILDARTMEIVSAAVGALSKPGPDLEAIRAAVKSRPPSY